MESHRLYSTDGTIGDLNKKALVDIVAGETGQTKTLIGKVIASTLGAIEATVAKGDKVTLYGFGTFSRRSRAARAGRNPSTGTALQIPAMNVPVFSASSVWKTAVRGKKPEMTAKVVKK